MNNISFQQEFRPELPNTYGTKDYREFRETIIKIDAILGSGNFEHNLVIQAIEKFVIDKQSDRDEFYNSKNADHCYRTFRHALRCNIARHLTNDSYRSFSIKLADSNLFQWFTGINAFSRTKGLCKNNLKDYWLGEIQ